MPAVISNKVRRFRFEHNEMTQEQLAIAVGCTRQTIFALEKGRYVPSLGLALKIAKVFQTTVDDLFQLHD